MGMARSIGSANIFLQKRVGQRDCSDMALHARKNLDVWRDEVAKLHWRKWTRQFETKKGIFNICKVSSIVDINWRDQKLEQFFDIF